MVGGCENVVWVFKWRWEWEEFGRFVWVKGVGGGALGCLVGRQVHSMLVDGWVGESRGGGYTLLR